MIRSMYFLQSLTHYVQSLTEDEVYIINCHIRPNDKETMLMHVKYACYHH